MALNAKEEMADECFYQRRHCLRNLEEYILFEVSEYGINFLSVLFTFAKIYTVQSNLFRYIALPLVCFNLRHGS